MKDWHVYLLLVAAAAILGVAIYATIASHAAPTSPPAAPTSIAPTIPPTLQPTA